MKSLGFLCALATAIAVISAENLNYAGAQANAAAWAEAAAAKGATVISVPTGTIVRRKPGSSNRPPQAKAAAAAKSAASAKTGQPAAAKSAASAKAGQPANRSNAGHAANAQAVPRGQPKPHHPGHAPHHAGQPTKPASGAPQTAAATASSQAVAVAKTPRRSSDKDSHNSSKPFELPDFGALAIPHLLGDLPEDFGKVIQSALTEGPLIKALSGLVSAFTTAQATAVPVIIAGIHKVLKDAADLISPENVEKAVAALADKYQDVLKGITAKIVEFAVSHADKIGSLIKHLAQATHLAQAAATALSVATTLYLIFQNEVLPKIPIDLTHLPVIPLDKLPIPLDKLPIPLDKLPVPLDKLPVPLDKLPIPLDKLPIPIEKFLELLGQKLSLGSDKGDNQDPSNGQGGPAVAKADSAAKAVAVAPDGAVAVAEAQSSAAAGSPITSDEEVETSAENEAFAAAA